MKMNSVRWNIGFGMFILMTIVAFGVYQFLTFGPQTDIDRVFQDRFEGQASVLASALNSTTDSSDIAAISGKLNALVNGNDLQHAIVASETEVVSAYTRDGQSIDGAKVMTALQGVSTDGTLYRTSTSIKSNSSLQLYAGFSTASAVAAVDDLKFRASLLAVFVFLLGLGGSTIIASLITRPLTRLVAVSQAVESGEISERLENVPDDEIGTVTKTFNTMTTKVQELSSKLEVASEDMALYSSEVESLKTDRVKFETALKASERRFRTIVENTNDIFVVIDDDLKVKWISATYERVAGQRGVTITGQAISEMIDPDDLENVKAVFDSEQEARPAFEARFKTGDEVWHDVLINVKDLRTTSGVGGVLLTVTDISETKNTQRELEHAKETAEEMIRLKDSFLANMSHEIRTPLTGILGFAQVLQEELDGEQKQLVQYIKDGGDRLLKTLNSFLDLAQLESNSVNFNLERLDLITETKNVVLHYSPQAEARGLEMNVTADESVLFARIDRSIFVRILQNLLHNAFKFTTTGSISITLVSEDNWVRVDVVDTGVGIDDDFLPFIFKEFHQESSGLTRTHEGTGLGLSITKRLLNLLDGTIQVTSTKGVGSTFTFRLPAAPQVHRTSTNDDAEQDMTRSATPAVLLVEDNPDTQLLVSRLIRNDYDVTVASSGQSAVNLATSNHFDLIIMDINLGDGLNGIDSLKEIRRLGKLDVPVIAVTAYALPGDEANFIKNGFTDYLSKPFSRDDLLAMIKRNISITSDSGRIAS